MSRRANQLAITFKDLRIAKLSRRAEPKPCTQELESFLAALYNSDNEKVPFHIAQRLADCMDKPVSNIALVM